MSSTRECTTDRAMREHEEPSSRQTMKAGADKPRVTPQCLRGHVLVYGLEALEYMRPFDPGKPAKPTRLRNLWKDPMQSGGNRASGGHLTSFWDGGRCLSSPAMALHLSAPRRALSSPPPR